MGNEQQEPRQAGRPAIGEKVEVRLPEDLARRVAYYAANTSRSRADALRVLIAASVERVTPADPVTSPRVASPAEQTTGYLLADRRVRLLHRRQRQGETSLRLHVKAGPSVGTPDMGDRGPALTPVGGVVIGVPENLADLTIMAQDLADIAKTLADIAAARSRTGGDASNAKALAGLADEYNLRRSPSEMAQDGDL